VRRESRRRHRVRGMGITLVIRTLNEESGIARCIEGVVRQTRRPDEVIVADNGSSDATLSIVAGFERDGIVRVIHCPTRGYVAGLNAGAEVAANELVAYLSADCVADERWLEELEDVLLSADADVVQGREIPWPPNDIHAVLAEQMRTRRTGRTKFFSNTNTLYKKSTLAAHLPFDEPEGLGGEDVLMSLAYAEAGRTAYFCSTAVVRHDMFPTPLSFRRRLEQHGRLCAYLLVRHPFRPRVYLNAYVWGLRELLYGALRRDPRFVRIAVVRVTGVTRGMMTQLVAMARTRRAGRGDSAWRMGGGSLT
jgi:glycosyltransferase involved in cell wall biosynthesis